LIDFAHATGNEHLTTDEIKRSFIVLDKNMNLDNSAGVLLCWTKI
jgi:hypothetical protein